VNGQTGHLYLIALGSNRRHHRHGQPATVLLAALAALTDAGVTVQAVSPIFATAPDGPAQRRFANAAASVRSALPPLAMLALIKGIERKFGRRRGQRWGDRVLDIDIIGWSGARWATRSLSIPHPRWRERRFVLAPLACFAPDWRAHGEPLRVRHHLARLIRAKPVDPSRDHA
jgi:2-amino-4-hydroxy-6-hydroxymethyldihydropteridine diphosphokinase